VLLSEVVEALRPAPGLRMLDGTFGRGGHTAALLRAGAGVLALDQDPGALASPEAAALKEEFGERLKLMKENFAALERVAQEEGPFDGILLDLGVSSPQLDDGARGFSFLHDGPLDMRMDPESPVSAADIVNRWSEPELARMFREYGEEAQAGRIARALVRRRASEPFTRTGDLAAVVEEALGGRRDRRIHPATKTFQALRIQVNDELGALDRVLEALPGALRPGGRCAIISFHALEDRRVKAFLTRRSTPEIRGAASPFGRPNPDCCFHRPARWLPTEEEIHANPRARSARLRAAIRN
jgi:16S rRNA (cytosine1402-N4)-methyltransferase